MSHAQNFLDSEPQQRNLPHTTAVRILSIASIPAAFFYALPGIIFGLVGFLLANKDLSAYRNSPAYYSARSFSSTKTGRICAAIGLALGAVILLALILYFIFYGEFTMERMKLQ